MKPDSNLNAILQDGYYFKNMPNYGRPGAQAVKISTHQIGELILTSGRIIACDPLVDPDTRYYFKKTIGPGHYPIIVSVANFQSSSESRFACAMLRLNNKTSVRWEVAFINEPNTNRTEDRISYGVDAGTGCFMDLDAAQILGDLFPDEYRFEGFCDRIIAEMDKNSFGQYKTAGWANMKVSEATEANIIAFSSGWGDGGYASFWGYDEVGELTSLVTDFALFPDDGAV